MLYENPVYRIMGDRSLLVELGDEISLSVNQRVRELFLTLERHRIDGVVEAIPCYRSLHIIYDPLKITLPTLQDRIKGLRRTMNGTQIPKPRTVKIPVLYGGEYGPDLVWVARYHKISPEEVIRLHTGSAYHVYGIGFAAGYAYMGSLPEALVTPRKETPRTIVPQGSVGIAQKQTGIYPVESPGGWQIIGRTPLKLFDPTRLPPTPLEMGDLVRFFPIREEEMAHWQP
jgi:KipI family sensor histidine kinase inhibitor